MPIPYFHLDAFADAPFTGNPAAVCLLERWLDDTTLQAIANENGLSETAFLVKGGAAGADFAIRWMTPVTEVELCGHATLASAHVLFEHLEPSRWRVTFSSRSGALHVERTARGLTLELPLWPAVACPTPDGLAAALRATPKETHRARDLLVVLEDEHAVRGLMPDFEALAQLPDHGVIVTAPGSGCDFVSRYFAPRQGLPEDPVTGSAHCTLAPFWAERLGKTELLARQVSARGGALHCRVGPKSVFVSGNVITYVAGTLAFPASSAARPVAASAGEPRR